MKKGCTRIVFRLGKYVIKIPNFLVEHRHGLQGMYANWSERQTTKRYGSYYRDKISPTIYSSWFGLFSIQRQVEELTRHLTEDEVEYFKDLTSDIKMQNFGYLEGKLVCIDYV